MFYKENKSKKYLHLEVSVHNCNFMVSDNIFVLIGSSVKVET